MSQSPRQSLTTGSPDGAVARPGDVDLPLASVEDLRVYFRTKQGFVHAVDGVNFEIADGETLGLVGETGCGKSVTARSFLRLVPMPPGVQAGGRILFRPKRPCERCEGVGCEACSRSGRVPTPCASCGGHGCTDCGGTGQETLDLLRVPLPRLRAIRGDRVAMIFQDPSLALNPALSIRQQLAEVFFEHRAGELLDGAGLSHEGFLLRRAAQERSTSFERRLLAIPPLRARRQRLKSVVGERIAQALADTRIGNPRKIMDSYPHELSGGMKQRVMIAQALACDPDLLIADEPTTALDVTIQARILDLIRELQERHRTAVLYISHDLSLVRQVCDRVVVMYAGQLAEEGPTGQLFREPLHPYTRGLLAAIPSGGQRRGHLVAIEGRVPELVDPPDACRFHTRCPHAARACAAQTPRLLLHRLPEQRAACFLHEDAADVGVEPADMPTDGRSSP
ncbi:MAG: oligopeptide/dipeptide ABC transporter ATP-binding protein [Nocardioidaceae bacterium]